MCKLQEKKKITFESKPVQKNKNGENKEYKDWQ